MDNMRLYDKWASPPDNALRSIRGGRLKGKTDINPMWRIEALTKEFGPAGVGWGTTGERYETYVNPVTNEVAIFCHLYLWYIDPDTGKKSEPVYGIGGNMLVSSELGYDESGNRCKVLYTNDEAYKMARTDAISVACKELGVAANVYWDKRDGSKYKDYKQAETTPPTGVTPIPEQPSNVAVVTKTFLPAVAITNMIHELGITMQEFSGKRDYLVSKGLLRDIASKDMTEDDVKQMKEVFERVYSET